MATKKKTQSRSKTTKMGCGLVEELPKRLPTSEADAIKILELTQKVEKMTRTHNELIGVRVALRTQYPGRVFDDYTPKAILDLCSENKKLAALLTEKVC